MLALEAGARSGDANARADSSSASARGAKWSRRSSRRFSTRRERAVGWSFLNCEEQRLLRLCATDLSYQRLVAIGQIRRHSDPKLILPWAAQ